MADPHVDTAPTGDPENPALRRGSLLSPAGRTSDVGLKLPPGTVNIMDIVLITAGIGWTLAIVAIATAWPQTYRLVRTRVPHGVDPRTAGLAALTMVAWTGYTVNLGDIPAVVSSIGPLLAWATTLITLVALGTRGALVSLIWTTCAAGALTVLACTPAWGVLGAIAAAGSAGWAIPQLRTAFTATRLDGISITAYAAMALENVGWILYAFLTSTPAYAVGASIQAPATAFIAWKALGGRRRTVAMAQHPSFAQLVA